MHFCFVIRTLINHAQMLITRRKHFESFDLRLALVQLGRCEPSYFGRCGRFLGSGWCRWTQDSRHLIGSVLTTANLSRSFSATWAEAA